MLLAAVDFDCWLNNFVYCVEFLLIFTVVVVFALVLNRSLLLLLWL